MKTTQTFSILIWVNKTRKSNQGCSLYARITVNGKRAEISLKRKIDPERWDFKNSRMRGNGIEARSINNHIQEVKAELYRIYNYMASTHEFITAEAIKLRFTGEESPRKTLLQVTKIHNEELNQRIGNGVSKATHTKYYSLEKKLISFVKKHLKKSDIYLEQLKHGFVTEFEYFLRSKENLNSNTTMKYIRMLKKIMNDTVRKDWLDKNPFQNFKCTFHWPDKEVLTMEELQQIMEKEFTIERLQQVKDYFVFSCFTGLAYVDLVGLEPNDISIGIDGGKWLMFERQKTGSPSKIPLLFQAESIINKYKKHPKSISQGTVFPPISNQKLNSYLKEIADLCGIKKNLTFHLARHTFATTVTLANGVPIESVSKMLGHTSIKTTQIYAKVVEKKLSEDMLILKEKLNSKSMKPKKQQSDIA